MNYLSNIQYFASYDTRGVHNGSGGGGGGCWGDLWTLGEFLLFTLKFFIVIKTSLSLKLYLSFDQLEY